MVFNTRERLAMGLLLTSTAFADKTPLPARFTCEGEDINPPLEISGVGPATRSLALVVDDPDAPGKTWVHWLVFNIPPEDMIIEENSVPAGAVLGKNDFGHIHYGGPCPPSGRHRYFFKLYALDTILELDEGASKDDIETVMEGHIIDRSVLIGYYQLKNKV